ncbi:MAG: class I SAM-dependent methyltransferase [candidate division WOR-3 bacterium]
MERSAYDRFFELEQHHFWRRAKRQLVLEWAENYLPPQPDRRILDIGGACSLITKELERFGTVVCLEADLATVELARERLGVDIRQGVFPEVVPEGNFDVITMLDVLEHIADDRKALSGARQLLKPEGLLMITVPALRWLWSGHDLALHHYRRYHRAELVCLLRDTGFRILRVSYYTSLLLPVLAIQRLLSKLRRRTGTPQYDVRVPAKPLNRLFAAVMSAERCLLRRINLPLGSSLVAAAKPD